MPTDTLPVRVTGSAPHAGATPRPRKLSRLYRWIAFAVFCGMQVALIVGRHTAPFLDEGTYITAGLRTLEGHGFSDGYLTWFAGSLVWPILAAVGYEAGGLGLVGTRLIAFVCVLTGVAAAMQSVADLYGERAALLSTLVLLPWGPLLALAHLGVYDTLAVTGVGLSLFAVVRSARRDHRGWIVAAALALLLAIVAKYPAAVFAVALAGLIVVLRGRSARIDVAIFIAVMLVGLQLVFLPQRSQLAVFLEWRVSNDPDFGVTASGVAFTLAWLLAVPMTLALLGSLTLPRRLVAIPLLLGALLLPAWHVVAANSVGASKHAVFSALLVAPLVGHGLNRIARGPAGVVVTVVVLGGAAVTGLTQMQLIDRQWADARPAADFLMRHVDSDDRVLLPVAWQYMPALYADGHLSSPWQVYDAYRVEHGQLDRPVCAIDWFVDEQRGNLWPRSLLVQIEACNSFQPVHRSVSTVTNLGTDLRFHSYDVVTTVWRNTADERS